MRIESLNWKGGVAGRAKWPMVRLAVMALCSLLLASVMFRAGVARAQDEDDQRIKDLERRLEELEKDRDRSSRIDLSAGASKFRAGGYGEMHMNFVDGKSSGQKFDIHRLVLDLGYDFSNWIKLQTETELEHAFVNDDNGEVAIEQAYVDFLLSDMFNVRFGRVLTPLGIINKKHEPPTFNGVERPFFATYIIPSTWSSDGLGFFGYLTPSLKYEAYVVGGLDGSMFNAKDGIRKGRIKERPSLNQMAFTGRLDYYLLAEHALTHGQNLRVGFSAYGGGLDNGNIGKDPDLDGYIQIYSADFEYTILNFDFRGAFAHENILGAKKFGSGTASEIRGWYVEGGGHFWPDAWKVGKLGRADAVVFARYEDIDTQFAMPSGVARDKAGDRSYWTLGVNFWLMPNFVVKADYQFPDDATGDELDNLINLGVGWQF